MTWLSTRRKASVGKRPLSGIPPANETTVPLEGMGVTARERSLSAPRICALREKSPDQSSATGAVAGGSTAAGGHRALGDERALPYMGARPARGHQLFVGERDRAAVDAELPGELPRGRQLHARRQEPLVNEPLQVRLDLARQRRGLVAIERDVHPVLLPSHFGRIMEIVKGQLA